MSAPVVFLHGAMSDRRVWAGEAARLEAAGRTVLNLDLPGHGARSAEPGERTLAGLAAGVRAEIDGLGAPTVLVGWSLGAAVAMRLALDGLAVRGLVLVAATPQAVATPAFTYAVPVAAARQRDQGLRAAYDATARLFARQVAPDDAEAAASVLRMALDCPPETARAVFDATWLDGLTDELHRITARAVMVHAWEDCVVPFAAGQYLEQNLPNALGMHVLEDTSHAPMLTMPDTLGDAMDDSLAALAAHPGEVLGGE